mmetsp:Transcript_99377/g.252421  ORF Transcript_99377/g.252421 Transcript_99377/m.252421 type:complete len:111 (-) Transcript_99377:831-1163(-)
MNISSVSTVDVDELDVDELVDDDVELDVEVVELPVEELVLEVVVVVVGMQRYCAKYMNLQSSTSTNSLSPYQGIAEAFTYSRRATVDTQTDWWTWTSSVQFGDSACPPHQ